MLPKWMKLDLTHNKAFGLSSSALRNFQIYWHNRSKFSTRIGTCIKIHAFFKNFFVVVVAVVGDDAVAAILI